MRFVSAASLLTALSVQALAAGCADLHRGPRTDASEQAPMVEDSVFETTVYPLLQAHCQSCHSTLGEASLTKFILTGDARADRLVVLDQVSLNYPRASMILRKASGEAHTGGQIFLLDGPEYQTIVDWVAWLSAAESAAVASSLRAR
jgi:hypothetical protein